MRNMSVNCSKLIQPIDMSLTQPRCTRILDDTTAQNHRIRNLLQQVGASIRDYDGVQSSITDALGISYPKIPADVLEAFSHDPSAVTSTTRYTSGWRAVEDIHERVCRQRETLGAFAMTMLSQPEDANTSPQNVFHDPIASLKESLMDLERHQQRIATQADNVAETLARVKEVHRTVKKDYNDTLAHTSLIYPEVHIASLEVFTFLISDFHSSRKLWRWRRATAIITSNSGIWVSTRSPCF